MRHANVLRIYGEYENTLQEDDWERNVTLVSVVWSQRFLGNWFVGLWVPGYGRRGRVFFWEMELYCITAAHGCIAFGVWYGFLEWSKYLCF